MMPCLRLVFRLQGGKSFWAGSFLLGAKKLAVAAGTCVDHDGWILEGFETHCPAAIGMGRFVGDIEMEAGKAVGPLRGILRHAHFLRTERFSCIATVSRPRSRTKRPRGTTAQGKLPTKTGLSQSPPER